MDEVESSSDAPSATQFLDKEAVSPSTSHISSQRRELSRSHLFHKNSHFRKLFLTDSDEAAK